MPRGHVILLFVAVAALAAATHSFASAPSDAQRGLELAGLKVDENGPCGRLYELEVPGADAMCTHGPDPAPAGVDVTETRDTAELQASTAGDAGVPCIGDGTSGPRVRAVYAVASDRTDRYDSLAGTIAGWAGVMDQALNDSAAKTGGERHIRFVTRADCSLDLAHVVLSPTGDDNFSNMVTELRNQGYNQTGRKYLIWMDATVYCGVAQVTSDDTAGSANRSNTAVGYARVDSGCWGRSDHSSELHELMHNLGAVQNSAPHSTGGFHCTDEYDVMCYRDSSTVTLTYPCASSSERLLDCGNDDYFHTAPPTGSYLATKWNTADSVFLHVGPVSGGGGGGGGGTGTPALSLARTASPSSYSSVGQTISYGYTVTNSGTASLGPAQLSISDTRVGGGSTFACGSSSTTLAPGATVSCSASTTVTQADLDAGSISSSATASTVGLSSSAVVATVTASQTKALGLTRTASPTTYAQLGETIAYGYTVKNAGTVTLGPAQFTVSDTRVGGGTAFACGTSTSLAPGATVSCSASTTVTQADLDAGSISSSATAAGGGATSAAAAVTVQKATVSTTTTTLSGSLSPKKPKKAFALTVGSGATVNALTFTPTGRDKSKGDVALTLRLLAPNGSLVAEVTGSSVLRLTTGALPRGTYTWEVSGSASVSFALEVTYTTP